MVLSDENSPRIHKALPNPISYFNKTAGYKIDVKRN
jgi:hypothetical protein